MRFIINCLLLIGILTLNLGCQSLSSSNIPDCPEHNKKQQCFATLEKIAPTQMNIGRLAIVHRGQKIREHSQKGTLKRYLLKRKAPAILGPDKRYYIIDRHHLAYSLYSAAIPWSEKKMLIEVLHQADHENVKDFWNYMTQNEYVYLMDNGKQKTVKDLPIDISKMTNDSYRSLVWLAFKTKTINKPKNARAYYDFELAEKLRARIDLTDVSEISRSEFTPYLDKVKEVID